MRADPATGHDIGAWETQKGIANPYESGSLVVGSTAGWWTNDKKTELLEIMRTTPTGSEASVEAYKEMCQLITEYVPWIGFGTAISSTYTQPNVELNYQGTSSYYWNTYFVK
jgi:ABC-type transport system substrate-binding protein